MGEAAGLQLHLGWRWRFHHVVDQQTAPPHLVDISAQGPMGERQFDTRPDLVGGDVVSLGRSRPARSGRPSQ